MKELKRVMCGGRVELWGRERRQKLRRVDAGACMRSMFGAGGVPGTRAYATV